MGALTVVERLYRFLEAFGEGDPAIIDEDWATDDAGDMYLTTTYDEYRPLDRDLRLVLTIIDDQVEWECGWVTGPSFTTYTSEREFEELWQIRLARMANALNRCRLET